MPSKNLKSLNGFHAQAQVIHAIYLAEAERRTIEISYPRLHNSYAIMEIQRLDGPEDEMPLLVFTDELGYIGVNDGEGHILHEIGRLDLPAGTDVMRAHAVKSIRWLLAQDIDAIRRRRGLPPRPKTCSQPRLQDAHR